MPRKKEQYVEEDLMDVTSTLAHKKHKKHKHKKHRRNKKGVESDGDEGSFEESPTSSEMLKPNFRLKIRFGGQAFGDTRLNKLEGNNVTIDESVNVDSDDDTSVPNLPSPTKKVKHVDEEDAWLAALEDGRLEEVDEELRRMKDPSLMTARQRSLLESKAQKDKDDAIPVVQEEKVMTEEMIQRKIIRAKKRKEQAEEKREKDKKQTLERLLKKTDAKVKGTKKFMKKTDSPKITYISSQIRGLSLSFPTGFDYPLKAQVAPPPPKPVLCGVKGCSNLKKYSCSKTSIPLCSLACYKKNLATSGITFPVT